MFRGYCSLIFLSLTVRAAILNSDDKLVALNSGGEHIFNCYDEIEVHQSDCTYEKKGQKMTVDPRKRCQIRFTCNSTVFTGFCCFEGQYGSVEKTIDMVTHGRADISDSIKEIDKSNSTMFNLKFEDNYIKIKLDGTLKLLLLLLILLLMIILTSIVFCKIWCMKRMLSLEPKSYAVFGDNVKKEKSIKCIKNTDVKRNDNLINLNQEDQELNASKEDVDIINFPLQV